MVCQAPVFRYFTHAPFSFFLLLLLLLFPFFLKHHLINHILTSEYPFSPPYFYQYPPTLQPSPRSLTIRYVYIYITYISQSRSVLLAMLYVEYKICSAELLYMAFPWARLYSVEVGDDDDDGDEGSYPWLEFGWIEFVRLEGDGSWVGTESKV